MFCNIGANTARLFGRTRLQTARLWARNVVGHSMQLTRIKSCYPNSMMEGAEGQKFNLLVSPSIEIEQTFALRHPARYTKGVEVAIGSMPRVFVRQKYLGKVRNKLVLNIALQSERDDDLDSDNDVDSLAMRLTDSDTDFNLESSDDSEAVADMLELEGSPDNLLELYGVMECTRYFQDKGMTNKSKEFATQFFNKLPPLLFRQMTRMDKAAFFALVDMIESHPVFSYNSPNQQAPVKWQLAVTLDRLGHNGNGSCLNRSIPTWQVSNGSLCNFSARCFTALEQALKAHLKWPNKQERRRISEEFGKKGFLGCVGLIDGTYIPLSQRPKEVGECYFDRKSQYSINTQVVFDHNRRILFLFTGMPGSCADITCRKKCSLYCKQNNGTLFRKFQYLLGNSGYQSIDHLVCSFKRSETSQDKEDFNKCVAKCRVANKHCIGVLKSRWHLLREMQVQLKEKKDFVWLVCWIMMCARLHNYVISRNDLWTEADESIVLDNESSNDEMEEKTYVSLLVPQLTRPPVPKAMTLQASVVQYALLFHKQPRGVLHN